MKTAVRAHDLLLPSDSSAAKSISESLFSLGADGAQLVTYKSLGIPREPGAVTRRLARETGNAFAARGKKIFLLGAYFNPVHPDAEKAEFGDAVFRAHLREASNFSCSLVASETGSFAGDKWIYHPENRTEAARLSVVREFSSLCDYAASFGARVGIEGAAAHVCFDSHTLAKTVNDINAPNLAVILDIFNFLDETNARDYMEIARRALDAFGDKIYAFHLKDCVFTGGAPRQCPFGRGEMDWQTLLSLIFNAVPDPILIFEGTTGADLPFAFSHLKEIVNILY